jgi:flagellar hook-associated protein 3 FlgL
MIYDQVRGNVAKNRSEQMDLQNQAATQKRVTRPSDDPVAAARVLGERVDLAGTKQYLKSLDYAKSFLEYSDESLHDLTESLVRAKELALSQANDPSANEQTRRVTAVEIQQIFNQMVAVGNRKLGDRFIFGGFHTTSPPFNDQGDYHGDDGEMMIHADKTQFIPMNVPGSRVFLGTGMQAKVDPGDPSAKPDEAGALDGAAKSKGSPAGENPQQLVEMRGPASEPPPGGETPSGGSNVFAAVKNLEIALQTNDKAGVQDALDDIDAAIDQVVLVRAAVGSRVTAFNNLSETLQKGKVDSQTAISQNEDADVYQVVSDINKNESTLQATLQTSGKMVQKSLMDFLR